MQHHLHRPELSGQHRHLKHPLPLAPVHSKYLVALELLQRFLEVVVQPIDRVLLRIRRGFQRAALLYALPKLLAYLRVVRQVLGDNVLGPLQGLLNSIYVLFRVYIPPRKAFRTLFGDFPVIIKAGEKELRKGLQPLLSGYAGPGAALGAVGPVEVLHLGHGGGVHNGALQLRGKLLKGRNRSYHLVLALLKAAKVL